MILLNDIDNLVKIEADELSFEHEDTSYELKADDPQTRDKWYEALTNQIEEIKNLEKAEFYDCDSNNSNNKKYKKKYEIVFNLPIKEKIIKDYENLCSNDTKDYIKKKVDKILSSKNYFQKKNKK